MKTKTFFRADTVLMLLITLVTFFGKNEVIPHFLNALLLLLASFYFLVARPVIIYRHTLASNGKLYLASSLIIGYMLIISVVGIYYHSSFLKNVTQGLLVVFLIIYYLKFNYATENDKKLYWLNLMLLILALTNHIIAFDAQA